LALKQDSFWPFTSPINGQHNRIRALCEQATARVSDVAAKGLSKEVSPKGVRVVRVSPGWVETDGAVGLVTEIARQNGTDYEGAKKIVMDSLAGPCRRSETERHGDVCSLCVPR
jgi:NAD(P)-dependent dehydrogenase (short-subunit alcohol dehydrogenase family)